MKLDRMKYFSIAIFSIAFIIRLVFVPQDNDISYSDAYVYDALGWSISQGNGYVNSDGTPHSFYPPFYPFFLSIIYRFFGHDYAAVRIVQSIIGAFSCVLIYSIGKRAIGAAAGGIAAFISIFYPPFIKSAMLLLTELFFTFILCLIVFYLLKIQEKMKFKNCIILGLLLGIAALTRSIMLFFPIFIIPAFIYLKDKYRISEIVKRYILILLAIVFTLMPWVIRNYNIYHKFVPASTEGGQGLYLSYCPKGGIFGFNAAPLDPVVIEGNKISSPILRSQFFIKKTVDFIAANPRKVLVLEVKKLLYFWAPFDWEIVGGRWFNLVYAAILPFFTLGVMVIFKQFRKIYPILLPIIYFQIMTLVFYGSPRFRLPIEPYIFILGAVGILQLFKHIFARKCEA